MFGKELIRVLKSRVWILLGALLLLNALMIGIGNVTSSFSADTYRQLGTELYNLDSETIESYLDERINYLRQIVYDVDDTDSEGTQTEVMEVDAEDPYMELQMLEYVRTEVGDILHYEEYCDQLIVQKENILAIGNASAAKKAMIRKEIAVYEKLKDISVSYIPSFGFNQALQFLPARVCMIIVMIYLAGVLYLKDEERGFLQLLSVMRDGGRKNRFIRLLALALACAGVTIAFTLETLLLFGWQYDSLHIDVLWKPLQCLYGFHSSPLQVNIITFIALYTLAVWFGGMVIVFTFLLIGHLVSHRTYTYGIAGMILITETILYSRISAHGYLAVLKNLNVISLLEPSGLIAQIQYLEIGPVVVSSAIPAYLLAALIIAISMGFLVICAPRTMQMRAASIGKHRSALHISLVLHELYKLSVVSRTYVILLVSLILLIPVMYAFRYEADGIENRSYKEIILSVQGMEADEGRAWINERQADMELLYEQALSGSDTYWVDVCQSRLNACERASAYADYICAHPGTEYLYSDEVNHYLSQTILIGIIGLLVTIGIGCSLGFYNRIDRRTGVECLQIISYTGVAKIRWVKTILSAGFVAVFCLGMSGCGMIVLQHIYSYLDLSSSASSIESLNMLPVNLSLGGYYWLILLAVTFIIELLALAFSVISAHRHRH